MAEPDEPLNPSPLHLETRGESKPSDTPHFEPSPPVAPLILERWAIFARRMRAGYSGYQANEQYEQVRTLLERRKPPTRKTAWSALMERFRSRRQGPDEPIRERR